MRYPVYLRYKPSGVEWLGDVPEHWRVKRGRFCMYVNPRSNRLRALQPDDEVSFVPMEAIGENGGMALSHSRAVADVGAGYTEFEDGDVLVAKITPCFENGKGALAFGLMNGAAFGTTELHVLRADQSLEPRYLFYFTISHAFRSAGEGAMYGAGGQKRVPPEFCENVQAPLPPIVEQQVIADFLDRETVKIDTLVAKKRTLIERLKEKRTALISGVVTRGLPPDAARAAELDPHPKLKPSGVDWLGDVPAHWDVKRLKFELLRIEQGWSPQCDNAPAGEGEWGILKAGAVNGTEFDPSQNKRLPDEETPLIELEIKPGDFLVSRANTRDLLGSAALVRQVPPRLMLCDKLYRLTFLDGALSPEFLLRFMRSTPGHYEYEREASGSSASMQNINQQSVRNLRLTVPPLSEQGAIVHFLYRETAKLDGMIVKVETAIERLQEYRTALITAAVTGKIDVGGTERRRESTFDAKPERMEA